MEIRWSNIYANRGQVQGFMEGSETMRNYIISYDSCLQILLKDLLKIVTNMDKLLP
jgi:hypothetical protein